MAALGSYLILSLKIGGSYSKSFAQVRFFRREESHVDEVNRFAFNRLLRSSYIVEIVTTVDLSLSGGTATTINFGYERLAFSA